MKLLVVTFHLDATGAYHREMVHQMGQGEEHEIKSVIYMDMK